MIRTPAEPSSSDALASGGLSRRSLLFGMTTTVIAGSAILNASGAALAQEPAPDETPATEDPAPRPPVPLDTVSATPPTIPSFGVAFFRDRP